MSTEDKPLPSFAPGPADTAVSATKVNGLPRAPRSGRRAAATAEPSAFSIIETDEVSRTLDFGMSEEDLEDVGEGEGSSSDLHDTLRALQDPTPDEDDFEVLTSTYESGIREEDTYEKKVVTDSGLPALEPVDELPPLSTSSALPPLETSVELPSLDTSDELPPLDLSDELPPLETSSSSVDALPVFAQSGPETPVLTRRERRLQEQTLPDFSKYDEPEKVEEPADKSKSAKRSEAKDTSKGKPKASTKEVEAKTDSYAKKLSPKLLMALAAVVLVVVIAVVVFVFVLPGAAVPGVITAPGAILSSFEASQLLQ